MFHRVILSTLNFFLHRRTIVPWCEKWHVFDTCCASNGVTSFLDWICPKHCKSYSRLGSHDTVAVKIKFPSSGVNLWRILTKFNGEVVENRATNSPAEQLLNKLFYILLLRNVPATWNWNSPQCTHKFCPTQQPTAQFPCCISIFFSSVSLLEIAVLKNLCSITLYTRWMVLSIDYS